jgi:hypothetical protein
VPPPAADRLARALHLVRRRRVPMTVAFLILMAGGLFLSVMWAPTYEVSTVVVAFDHAHVMHDWFVSRQAAESVVATMGEPFVHYLVPNGPRVAVYSAEEEAAMLLQERVRVSQIPAERGEAPRLRVTVGMDNAVVARDVAQAYLDSLDELRPRLENLTRAQLFDRYYTGDEAAALAMAQTAAQQRAYWLVFDAPTIPSAPVSPNRALIAGAGLVIALVVAAVLGAVLDWLPRLREAYREGEPVPWAEWERASLRDALANAEASLVAVRSDGQRPGERGPVELRIVLVPGPERRG